jgi:hypothetical protein
MKKTNSVKKIFLLYTVLAIFSALIFSSCHDDLYGAINSEVQLEKNGLQGDVVSFIHYKNSIVLANGYIYYKTNQPSSVTGKKNGQWNKAASPDYTKGDYDVPATTYFLASDENHLYALTYVWMEDEDDGNNTPKSAKLYVTDGDPESGLSWTQIDLSSLGVTDYSFGNVKVLFDNQKVSWTGTTASLSGRNAYARIRTSSKSAYKIYKLNGTGAPTEVSITASNSIGSDETNSISACSFNGNDYFSQYYSMAANDSYIYITKTKSTSSGHVSGDSSIYYSSDGSNFAEADVDEGSILSLAFTADYVLIGTSGGLYRVPLYGGIPAGGSKKFSNNGNSIITEYVFKVFVLDSSKAEGQTDEYAVSTIYGSISSSSDAWSDTGLYAYYPSRDEWNRDGD